MQIKKDREVNVDIRRKGWQYIIGELLVLCSDILRIMRFPLITCGRLPLQRNDRQYFFIVKKTAIYYKHPFYNMSIEKLSLKSFKIFPFSRNDKGAVFRYFKIIFLERDKYHEYSYVWAKWQR